MVCLLVACRKSTEDQNVLVRYLVETTAFEANPISVLFYSQVQCFPVLTPLDIILFYEISALASIESSDNIEGLVIECDCCVEVSTCIETSYLCPSVTSHIINFALVH